MDSQVRRPLPQSEDSFSVCSISSTFIPRSPVAVMHSELHTSDGHMKMLKSSRWSNELPCEFQAASRCCQNGRGSCAVVLLLPARGILIIAEPSVCHLKFGSRSLSNISSFVRLKVPWTLVSKTGPRCCSTDLCLAQKSGGRTSVHRYSFCPIESELSEWYKDRYPHLSLLTNYGLLCCRLSLHFLTLSGRLYGWDLDPLCSCHHPGFQHN